MSPYIMDTKLSFWQFAVIALLLSCLVVGGEASAGNYHLPLRGEERTNGLHEISFHFEKASNIHPTPRERRLNNRHKSSYYQFQDGDTRSTPTTLSDVWLCLACALGWSIWLVSTRQPPQQLIFEQEDSSKAMGHVLQVSLGEDILGTGIPVYYALVDFVVKGDTDEDHIQVRKVFTSKKMLEEGFANVEVLYLTNDPTTAILMDDLLDHQKERESQAPPSTGYFVLIYIVSVLLIGASLYGGIRMANRLENPLYGWISLVVGVIILYPAAKLLYRTVTYLYSLAGPLTERPGVIVHGRRLYWAKQCHGTLNPFQILGTNEADGKDSDSISVELSEVQGRRGRNVASKKKNLLFPNAGCGFGNFNVHLPTGRPRASSSVSSMSASASQHSMDKSQGCNIVRNDTSILEKYEMHVSANEKSGRK
mmetsp:Transcript_25667/g.60470  ORF Transcript_25667/g.60470 Transcript_25667/m.60470 type:complete len:423 (+) Transcript_25667:97-1365(+)